MSTAPATAQELEFRDALFADGLLLPGPARGVPGRGPVFAGIITGLRALLGRELARERPQMLAFPPVLPRALIQRVGYEEKFPHLLGSVCCFAGGAREHEAMLTAGRESKSVLPFLGLSDVVLTPAACYPVYPALSGALPEGGRLIDVEGWCYREEPSDSPTRLRSFQMRELICAGTPQQAFEFRERWVRRGLEILGQLGLPATSAPASDPFFGNAGRLLTATQKEQQLKLELVVEVAAPTPCALVSCNYHKQAFSELFGIQTADGAQAHTACVGFGLERVALALLHHHGFSLSGWPAELRGVLELS
jgi:seryl-tRNA synthetase